MTWVHQDPVTKSQRFTNSAGVLQSQRIDLDPWGNETGRTVDPATPQQKPTHRFTTYERDANGSDEAMHRRYNSVRTRFEQPDPFAGSYDLTNPQSLNRYSYDPVNFVDPTGLAVDWMCTAERNSCWGGWANGGSGYGGVDNDIFRTFRLYIGDGLYRTIRFSGQGLAPRGYASDRMLSDAECDKHLARIFGGKGAIVGSIKDPMTLGRFANNLAFYASSGVRVPPNFGDRGVGHGSAPFNNPNPKSADRGGIIHIYGNEQGSATGMGLYAPSNGTVSPVREETASSGEQVTVTRVTYTTGLTISFTHVTAAGGAPNAMGSQRIGNIGGLGGMTAGYVHTHIVFFSDFKKGIRVDPRKVFCGQ